MPIEQDAEGCYHSQLSNHASFVIIVRIWGNLDKMISTVNAGTSSHQHHGSARSSDMFDWTCCCLGDVHPKIRRSFPTLFGGTVLVVTGIVVSLTSDDLASPGDTGSNIGVQATSGFILLGFGGFLLLIGIISFCHGHMTRYQSDSPRSCSVITVNKVGPDHSRRPSPITVRPSPVTEVGWVVDDTCTSQTGIPADIDAPGTSQRPTAVS